MKPTHYFKAAENKFTRNTDMSSHYFRKSWTSFKWGVVGVIAFLTAATFTYSNAITEDSRSFAYFTGFLALIFLIASIHQFWEAAMLHEKAVERRVKPPQTQDRI